MISLPMFWFEQKIRRYEHSRWANEPSRPIMPFRWGLEHIGGRADEADPRGWLEKFATETIAHSDEWFAAPPATDYRLTGPGEAPGEAGVLTFTSTVESPWPENNRVSARFFPARHSGPAVVVLAQWNAKWHEQVSVCRWLNKLGISALRLSLPYHDRRAVPGHPRADHLVGANIGLTMQANRQAVRDARQCLRWLEAQGYDRLGFLGTSVGSAIAFVAFAHEQAVRVGAFLHASTYYGEVVANGLTTMNVWESLRTKVTEEELKRYWSPISPYPYIPKLHGGRKKILVIYGKYDPTFRLQFTQELLREVQHDSLQMETLALPCGHYSLGEPPFSWAAGFQFGRFLFQGLS